MSYSIKNLTAKRSSFLKKIKVLLFIYIFAKLIKNMNKIDCINFDRTNTQSGATNRIDKTFELRCIGKKSTTIRKRSYISANEEIRVVPLTVVVGTPSCKLFVYKLAIFIKKTIS